MRNIFTVLYTYTTFLPTNNQGDERNLMIIERLFADCCFFIIILVLVEGVERIKLLKVTCVPIIINLALLNASNTSFFNNQSHTSKQQTKTSNFGVNKEEI